MMAAELTVTTGPQLEDGYIRIANELWDALCRTQIPGAERQIMDVIFRKTYGFNKKCDAIPLSQFEAATGLDHGNICRAIKKLENKRTYNRKAGLGMKIPPSMDLLS